jgi:hypothetical protein
VTLTKDEMFGRVLDAIDRAPVGNESVPDVHGLPRDKVLLTVEELVKLGWLQAEYVNRGDGRLMNIWEPRLTGARRAALDRLRASSLAPGQKIQRSLDEKKLMRLQFMQELYAATDGSPSSSANAYDIGDKLGWTRLEADNIAEYLEGERLLKPEAFGGQISITHAGVREVEQSSENPSRPTQHFPPANVLVVGTIVDSQIQQGTSDSQQTQILTADQVSAVAEYLDEVRNRLDRLGLGDDDRTELEVELDTASRQLESPRPKLGRVRDSVRSVNDILSQMSSAAVASEKLLELAQKLHEAVPGL